MIYLLLLTSLWASDFEKEAKAILKPIKKSFMSEMKAGLAKGTTNALEVCHLKAPHIIEGAHNDKYKFGRTSHRVRNKNNAPEAWLKPILEEYKNSTAKNKLPAKLVKVGDKKAWVEPIYIKAVCLQCHGSSISKKLQKQLDEKYPKDMATDFKLGEFRGLFWIKQR
jgi:hypothetical protein